MAMRCLSGLQSACLKPEAGMWARPDPEARDRSTTGRDSIATCRK